MTNHKRTYFAILFDCLVVVSISIFYFGSFSLLNIFDGCCSILREIWCAHGRSSSIVNEKRIVNVHEKARRPHALLMLLLARYFYLTIKIKEPRNSNEFQSPFMCIYLSFKYFQKFRASNLYECKCKHTKWALFYSLVFYCSSFLSISACQAQIK